VNKLIIALALIALAGCSSKYRTDSVQRPPERLDTKGSVYVMESNDGAYAGKTYAGSGKALSSATVAELSKFVNRVDTAAGPEKIDDALAKAMAAGHKYVVQPTILHWEDRNTEWSGRPDRITIKLTVWDASSGKDLASNVSSASSKWGTFGGDHPQDLLPGALSTMVGGMF
jgi:hypothetical protein